MVAKATLRRGGGKAAVEDIDPETPSGRIIADANKLFTIKTATGSIKIRKMTAQREMMLARMFTTPVVNNMYYQWCWFAASIAEINGDPVPSPATELECMAIIERIGDDGVSALMQALENGSIK